MAPAIAFALLPVADGAKTILAIQKLLGGGTEGLRPAIGAACLGLLFSACGCLAPRALKAR